MDWASECKKTAMWLGWADSKWSQIMCLGGAENPLARASPGRIQPLRTPALESAPHWLGCSLGGGVKDSPAHQSAGAGASGSPPTRGRQLCTTPTWSCSASRLRIGAPTTCSVLRPRKLGGREEREEETGSLHTPSRPPLRAAGARGRSHYSSCRRYSLCLGCHLRRPTVRTRGATPPTLLWSR